MKVALILICLVSVAMAQSNSDKFYQRFTTKTKKTAQECAKEMGLPRDIVHRFITERYSKDVKSMGCLKACILTKEGMMVNCKMSVKDLYNFVDTVLGRDSCLLDELYEVQKTCAGRTRHIRNECEVALEFYNCASNAVNDIV